MDDQNMSDFYGRVARISKARAMGYGFEAPGTLGRSHYYKPQARRRAVIGPVLVILACAFLMKGAIHNKIGPDSYNERVAALMAGDQLERVGGWLMQEEAATLFVSDKINWALSKTM